MNFSTRLPLIIAGMVFRHLETGEPIAEGFLDEGVLYRVTTVSGPYPDHILNEWIVTDPSGNTVASLQITEAA